MHRDEPVAERKERLHALARERARDDVAAGEHEVGANDVRLSEHGLKRGKVPVDVEESCDPHRRR